MINGINECKIAILKTEIRIRLEIWIYDKCRNFRIQKSGFSYFGGQIRIFPVTDTIRIFFRPLYFPKNDFCPYG